MRNSEARHHSPGVERPRGFLCATGLGGLGRSEPQLAGTACRPASHSSRLPTGGRSVGWAIRGACASRGERDTPLLQLPWFFVLLGVVHGQCAMPGRAARSAARRAGAFLVYTITTPPTEAVLLCVRFLPRIPATASERRVTESLMFCAGIRENGTGRAVCDNNSASPTTLGAADRLTGTMHATVPLLYSIPDAAKMLAVSRRTLEREIASGRFPRPLKIGRSSRVSHGDVASYLEKLRAEVRR